MATMSSSRSSCRSNYCGPVLLPSSSSRSSSSAFASSSSRFSYGSPSTTSSHGDFFDNATTSNSINRSASPTRINIGSSFNTSSARISIDHHQYQSTNNNTHHHRFHHHQSSQTSSSTSSKKRTCMCSPTNHPGSFRCRLHKNISNNNNNSNNNYGSYTPSNNHQLNARRSAMTNSLVRIGTVEGELVKRALAALIRPSSHHQKRRSDFQPRPSPLSNMSKA